MNQLKLNYYVTIWRTEVRNMLLRPSFGLFSCFFPPIGPESSSSTLFLRLNSSQPVILPEAGKPQKHPQRHDKKHLWLNPELQSSWWRRPWLSCFITNLLRTSVCSPSPAKQKSGMFRSRMFRCTLNFIHTFKRCFKKMVENLFFSFFSASDSDHQRLQFGRVCKWSWKDCFHSRWKKYLSPCSAVWQITANVERTSSMNLSLQPSRVPCLDDVAVWWRKKAVASRIYCGFFRASFQKKTKHDSIRNFSHFSSTHESGDKRKRAKPGGLEAVAQVPCWRVLLVVVVVFWCYTGGAE